MIKGQRIALVHPASASARTLVAIAAGALMLMAAMALTAQAGRRASLSQAANAPLGAPTALIKARNPRWAAALAKARDTRGLSAQEAIAVSTAMLRVCEPR